MLKYVSLSMKSSHMYFNAASNITRNVRAESILYGKHKGLREGNIVPKQHGQWKSRLGKKSF